MGLSGVKNGKLSKSVFPMPIFEAVCYSVNMPQLSVTGGWKYIEDMTSSFLTYTL